MTSDATVGFIGLGIMGSRMAATLQQQGYNLLVFNRTPAKASDLVAQGAQLAESAAAVGAAADVLITMLAHPEAVEAMALHEQGFLAHLRPGTLWVDCSTVHPGFTRRMAAAAAERDVRFLDAPVAGSKNQAAGAQLVFLVGGAEEDVQRGAPLFEAMGRRTVHVGEQGMGSALKLVVNGLLATSMAAFAEAVVFGEGLGLPRDRLLDVLIGGPVAAPFLASKRTKLETAQYDAEFPLRWMHKDLQMVATAAYETGSAMPMAQLAKALYQLAIHDARGDDDFSAIYAFLRAHSPVEA